MKYARKGLMNSKLKHPWVIQNIGTILLNMGCIHNIQQGIPKFFQVYFSPGFRVMGSYSAEIQSYTCANAFSDYFSCGKKRTSICTVLPKL